MRDKAQVRSLVQAYTPDVHSARRYEELTSHVKSLRNRKKSLLDESHQLGRNYEEASQEIRRLANTTFVKSTASKDKKKSDFSGKKTHAKTTSKMSILENRGLRSTMLEHSSAKDTVTQKDKHYRKSISNFIAG